MFHILVVDDDKHTRKLLRAVLENAHYTVTTQPTEKKRWRLWTKSILIWLYWTL